MANLNLGRTIESRNGSQDPLLSSIKPIIEDFKVSGKVDDKMINMLFDAIKSMQQNQSDFQMQLTSENNDAIVMKFKSVIQALAETMPDVDSSALATLIAEQLESKQEKQDIVQYLKDTQSSNKDSEEDENPETVGEYSDNIIAENFQTLNDSILEQFKTFQIKFGLNSFKKMIGGMLLTPFKSLGNKLSLLKSGIGKSLHGLKDKFSTFGKGLLGKFKLPKIKLPTFGKGLLGKFKLPKNKLPKFGLPKLFGKSKSAKEKKAEKRQNSIFDSLEKLVKRLKRFANNAKDMVLGFIDEIILPAAKIIAKGIGIILKPVLSFLLGFFWGSGIGILLIAIGLGIALIAFAVKKLVDFIVDDLGPEIKRWMSVMTPEEINHFMGAVSNFLNTFNALIAGLFAPIIVIGTLIMSVIKPVSKFIKEVLESAIENIMPIIDKLFEIISKVVTVAIQYVRDHWDDIVAFIKGIPGKIWKFIQSIPSMVTKVFKKALNLGKFILGKIKGAAAPLANKEFNLGFGIKFRPFSFLGGSNEKDEYISDKAKEELKTDTVNIEQEQDIDNIENIANSTTEILEESDNGNDKKRLTLEQFQAEITKFLTDFKDITQKNFEEIAKKLDIPQVVPLPIPAQQINPALQENRW